MKNNSSTFKKGDKVRIIKIGKECKIIDIYCCGLTAKAKVEDEHLQVWSVDFKDLEHEGEIPLIEQLQTELDAARGIAEAAENELEKLKNNLARSEHSRQVNADNHERAIASRDEWMKIADERQLQINRLTGERDNWEQAAANFLGGMRYYHDLLVQCGQAIGKDAYTCDDGTMQQDVLVAKVPELVRGLVADKDKPLMALDNARDLIYDIMRDEVNAIDECEKWLRYYALGKLREAYGAAKQ